MTDTAERARLETTRGLTPLQRSYAVEGVEMRAEDDGSTLVNFYGHASVTDTPYEMYGGPDKGGWNETVKRGSFKRTLNAKPDVPFLINHGGMTLARTKAKTLDLKEDDTGLEVRARLDTRVSIVNDLAVLMEAGNIDEMSFAFRVKKQKWTDVDGEEVPWWDPAGINREISEVDIHKGDVSVVNYGANPYTDASLRSLADAIRSFHELDEDEIHSAIEQLQSKLSTPQAVHPELMAMYWEAKRLVNPELDPARHHSSHHFATNDNSNKEKSG